MSMAGGWFFLMISEAFVLGDKDFRLPGLGSYMTVAVARGDHAAMLWAVVAMVLMIVVLDQLLWRPLVVWAQKFRVEEGGGQEAMSSWFYDFLRRSRVLPVLGGLARRARGGASSRCPSGGARARCRRLRAGVAPPLRRPRAAPRLRWLQAGAPLPGRVPGRRGSGSSAWARSPSGASSSPPCWARSGRSPRASPSASRRASRASSSRWCRWPRRSRRRCSSPPSSCCSTRSTWSSPGGASSSCSSAPSGTSSSTSSPAPWRIPADLREAAESYHFTLRQQLQAVYLPSVFPYLVTGWVTAAGGAWNASIVSEYVTFEGRPLSAKGLGSAISGAAANADLSLLAAAVAVMSRHRRRLQPHRLARLLPPRRAALLARQVSP